MANFRGSLEEFEALVAEADIRGEWSRVAHGYSFRTADGAVMTWYEKTAKVQFQGPESAQGRLKALVEPLLEGRLGRPIEPIMMTAEPAAPGPPPRVFVVHGHDRTAREQLELILHRLNLDPYVLANTGGGGLTIIEALEQEIVRPSSPTRFGIVLMTPDDMGYAQAEGATAVKPRARQNVVLEMGMLIAALGRPRVAILRKGFLETPSDADGIIYIPFNDHARETVPRLVDRLRGAGFPIEVADVTRASA